MSNYEIPRNTYEIFSTNKHPSVIFSTITRKPKRMNNILSSVLRLIITSDQYSTQRWRRHHPTSTFTTRLISQQWRTASNRLHLFSASQTFFHEPLSSSTSLLYNPPPPHIVFVRQRCLTFVETGRGVMLPFLYYPHALELSFEFDLQKLGEMRVRSLIDLNCLAWPRSRENCEIKCLLDIDPLCTPSLPLSSFVWRSEILDLYNLEIWELSVCSFPIPCWPTKRAQEMKRKTMCTIQSVVCQIRNSRPINLAAVSDTSTHHYDPRSRLTRSSSIEVPCYHVFCALTCMLSR